MYAHSIYWSDDQTLANGSYLWTANFTDAVAANVNFIEGAYTITTNSNGLVTKALIPNWYDDASDAHHAVTRNGSVTQSNEGGGVVAALFDGFSNLVYTDNSDFNFADGDFTVQFFAKPGIQFAAPAAMVTTATPTDFEGILAGHRTYLQTLEGNGGSWLAGNVGGANLTDGAWNHIEYSRSSGVIYAFVNGTLSHTYPDNYTLSNANNLVAIGGRPVAGQFFVGKIAALQIIKGTALHTSAFSVPTALPTAVTGTVLLLNFEATAVPTV
jgi:hypothetical protein